MRCAACSNELEETMKTKPVRRPHRLVCGLAWAVLAHAALLPLANASGPFLVEPLFFDTRYEPQPFIDGASFAAEGRSLALVATWLHMSGNFGDGQRALFEAYLQQQDTNREASAGYGGWQQALRELGREPDYFGTMKWVTKTTQRDGQDYTTQSYFENCLDDAFDTATATLRERLQRHGRDSVQLQRWIAAQEQVFSHCDGDAFMPPAEPDPAWEPLERHDRAYQVAAAYFYAMDYDEAARRFAAIGEDTASPWSELARYLVGRSRLRQALVADIDRAQNLAAASDTFAQLAQDAGYVQRFPSVVGQQSYISIKQDTPAFLERVGNLLASDPAQLSASEFSDYLFLWNRRTHVVASDGGLGHWLQLANDPSPQATQGVLDAWRTYRTQPWLYLALYRAPYPELSRDLVNADTAVFDELVAATEGLTARTPQDAALLLARAGLLQQRGRNAELDALAQRTLDDAQSVLTQTQRNRLQFLRAQAGSWRDFVAQAQLPVTALTFDTNEYINLAPEAFARATHRSPLLPREALALIDSYYTPAMMLSVVEEGGLSGYLVGRFAIAGWVKALMLGDDMSARAFARILRNYYPERRAALDRYLDGPEPAFEAAALVLELPGYSPFLPTGIGRERWDDNGELGFVPDHVADGLNIHNWWCTAVYDYQDAAEQQDYRAGRLERVDADLALPLFASLDAGAKAELAEIQPRLQQGVAAVFGPAIIDYARHNVDDARVARLLHRVVFASRYACSGGPGTVSRAAFQLLHANYPGSEWAKQTPYWYD
jgi:hypothetical protein